MRTETRSIWWGEGAPGRDIRVLVASCAADDSFMSLVPAEDFRTLVERWRGRGARVDHQSTDCSTLPMVTNPYGWIMDLFGMQTVDWLAAQLER